LVTVAFPGPKGRIGHPDLTQNIGQNLTLGYVELFTYWRYFAFIANRTEPMHEVDSEHRQHAQVELVIRRPQRSSARALPVRPLQRQQRLDGDRLPRAQPHPLDQRSA
jgi:hypothetical protein